MIKVLIDWTADAGFKIFKAKLTFEVFGSGIFYSHQTVIQQLHHLENKFGDFWVFSINVRSTKGEILEMLYSTASLFYMRLDLEGSYLEW